MHQVRIVLELREPFDEQVGILVADLAQAAAEGEQHLDELLAALPTRIRRLFKQCVVARAAHRNPPEPASMGGPSNTNVACVHVDEGPPAGSSAERPQGLSDRRRGLAAEQSAVPAFTRFRRARGLGLRDIAHLAAKRGLPISKSTIHNIEIGEISPRRHHAQSIAAALEIELVAALALFEPEAPPARLVELES
jgi:hypothetical protein